MGNKWDRSPKDLGGWGSLCEAEGRMEGSWGGGWDTLGGRGGIPRADAGGGAGKSEEDAKAEDGERDQKRRSDYMHDLESPCIDGGNRPFLSRARIWKSRKPQTANAR